MNEGADQFFENRFHFLIMHIDHHHYREYTMNQGVLPVILFPLEKTPFTHLRDVSLRPLSVSEQRGIPPPPPSIIFSLTFQLIDPVAFLLLLLALCNLFRNIPGN